MDGFHRAAEVVCHLQQRLCRERSRALELVLERFSVEELHPESGAAIETIGPVHGHHVRMLDLRQQVAFVDENGLGGIGRLPEQLERDVSTQPRIARAVDIAVRSSANLAEDFERPPCQRIVETFSLRSADGRVKGAEFPELAQAIDDGSVGLAHFLLRGLPVDGCPVSQLERELD